MPRKQKIVWPSDQLIQKKWPHATIVWTSVTMDIQIVKTGEQWGHGDVFRIVEGDRYSSCMYTIDEALVEALRRELFEEARCRRK